MNFVAAAFGVFGLLGLAACAPARVPPPSPPVQPAEVEIERPGPTDEIRVGLLLPLSGPAEALGQDMLKAAQLALFDVGDNRVVLLPRDTRGTPEAARQGAQEVIDEGATLILGPLFSQAVRAVSPIARAADVRVLAFSNDATARSEGTYLLGFRPEEQVRRVVRFAGERELRQIAGLAPDDPYGATALAALRRAVPEAGGQLGATAVYPPDLADPSAIVRQVAAYDQRRAALERERQRLQQQQDDEEARRELRRLETRDTFGDLPFDAVLIADGGDRLRSVASLLTFYDIEPGAVRFLGTMRWQDDPRVLQEEALQGGWFAASPPANIDAFKRRFQNTFGSEPQALAALAYDATALAVIVARDLGDPLYDPVTLTDPEGFAGATGLFRLRPDGLADHGLAILEVARGTAREIDPPPVSFVPEIAADFLR